MQVILFPNDEGGVLIVSPAPDRVNDVEAIAIETVPKGVPWRIVDEASLPFSETRERWRWTEDGPLEVAPPPPPQPASLTPAQWGFFLDLTGFRDALDAALDAMPKATMQERSQWAAMRAIALNSPSYALPVTLALVGQVRAMGLAVAIPADAEITEAFTAASQFKGAESLLGRGR